MSTMLHVRSVAPALLALLACASPALAGAAKLRLDLDAGTKLNYEMKQSQDMTMEMGPLGSQRTQTVSTFDLTYRVKSVDPAGTASVGVTYDRIRIDVDSPSGRINFDSAEPGGTTDNPVGETLPLLVGHEISVDLTPRGEVVGVHGFGELWEKVSAQFGSEQWPPSQVMEMMRQSFGEDSMKQLLQSSSVIFPEKAIPAGGSWVSETELTVPLYGTAKYHADYTLVGLEKRRGRDCRRIDFTLSVTFEGEGGMAAQFREMFAQQGADVEMSFLMKESTGSGTFWIDRKSGATVELIVDQDMGGDMTLVMGAGEQKNTMNMSIAIDQKIEVGVVP